MRTDDQLNDFLIGKSEHTLSLFHHFMAKFNEVGIVELHPTKTMIGISNGQKRVAWVAQLGKNFIHVVFPFKQAYEDNLCFQKIAQVPGDEQYNHHFRMLNPEDVNDEVMRFMRVAYNEEADL
ncbi:DUF5655 domain-containing protein [Mucilaginibacter sp. UR6-1]|uniref:DUF5655 domain-containing protein n=1 Tax=Mucilaginibacter sp. UR6-1 TaxID=1435643 RepID=UPI001E524141|nr:DUF5655 domain-containing protein [Mucilaginibacter sp. UR6-1]MCC8410079.1 DUF5655 domain-containing protein [Mucilaginibacter sp. UR6-1]